jgi:hypothetical protein
MKTLLKTADVIKEVRAIARQNGLTFKRSGHYINSGPAYHFICRTSGRIVAENFSLATAYDSALSGYLSGFNKEPA